MHVNLLSIVTNNTYYSVVKPNRSPSATRSASVGPKNPTFTSHVANKSKSSQVSVLGGTSSLNTGIKLHFKKALFGYWALQV